jgi:hypothetical protein
MIEMMRMIEMIEMMMMMMMGSDDNDYDRDDYEDDGRLACSGDYYDIILSIYLIYLSFYLSM